MYGCECKEVGTTDGQSPESPESHSKVWQMSDMEEDETVEHVECEKYNRDKMEMMHVILTEMGRGYYFTSSP